MNTNQIKDTSNKSADQSPNTVKNVDQKPCFTTSNALVFTNLHRAASEKAAKAVGIAAKDKNINQFIINSGMSDDARTISDENQKMNAKIRFSEASKNGRFEVGIVLQVNATPLSLVDDNDNQQDQLKKKNEEAIENARKMIFSGLQEYFKWFCGESKFNEDDMVQFIPDYNGGKVQVRDGEILGIEDYEEVLGMYNGNYHKESKKKELDDKQKLRIGYKVGYTIKYDK